MGLGVLFISFIYICLYFCFFFFIVAILVLMFIDGRYHEATVVCTYPPGGGAPHHCVQLRFLKSKNNLLTYNSGCGKESSGQDKNTNGKRCSDNMVQNIT